MAGIKQVEIEVKGARDLALISSDNAVWLVVPLRWWDFATLLWWFFCPIDRQAHVTITTMDGIKVHTRAVRVASKFIHVRGNFKS